jgi:hypothetical protein
MSIDLKGASTIMSGYVPTEPGAYVSNACYFFGGSTDADVRTGRIEFAVDTEMLSDTKSRWSMSAD